MEDSSNEKVKHEKKYYVYAFWSVCIYISIMCNLCTELFIYYILLLKFAISAILP